MSLAPRTPRPLLIEELFSTILYFLAEPSEYEPSGYDRGVAIRTPDADGRRALAALAQTCRGFSEQSLNHLWRRLDSLEPLIRCYAPRETVSSARRTLRPPSQADWVVINRYSHRIRELEIQSDSSRAFLGCMIFESPLLPNLRALKWKTRPYVNTIGITYIQPLLVPGIVVLEVGANEHDPALASFLKSCPSRCPRLTTINFHIYVFGMGLVDILSQSLCSFKNLKHLTLEAPINNTALQKLLMSSELEELTLWLRQNVLAPLDIPIRNVKKLDLTLNDLRPIIGLLRPGHQRLREITLRVHKLEFAPNIGSLFGELGRHTEKSPLRSLHLNNWNIVPHAYLRDCKSFVLSLDTFRPLALLTNLQELTINLENPIALSDAELADLARNWPLLQVIELCFDRRLRVKHLTFEGLLLLVAICTQLHAVSLTLDGREVPSGVAATLGSGCNAVTSLRLHNTPIDNPRLVAKFLVTYFPSATSVSGVSDTYKWALGVDKLGEDWAKVRECLADASSLESPEAGSRDEPEGLI